MATLGGVIGLLTLELAVSGIGAYSAQLAFELVVGLIILGDTMSFFWITMKQASFWYLLQ